MVVTIVDATVLVGSWQNLTDAYAKETINIPEDILQTFLIQSKVQPTKWRIITHWRSQEDLDKMRQTEKIPPAVRIFQSVNAKPSIEVWKIDNHIVNKHANYF
jgi:quinol monooxygenase YgiN